VPWLPLRHTCTQVKASRSITTKPHGGSSLGAGNSELKCDDDVAHPDEHVSEVSIRGEIPVLIDCLSLVSILACVDEKRDLFAGQEKEARNRWKEDAGTRSGVFQIRDSGSSSVLEPGSRNLQPLMAGGKEYAPAIPLCV
jgi:hypothetical protein